MFGEVTEVGEALDALGEMAGSCTSAQAAVIYDWEKQSELSIKFMALCYVFYTLTEHVLEFTMKKVEEIQPDFVICDTLAEWGQEAGPRPLLQVKV